MVVAGRRAAAGDTVFEQMERAARRRLDPPAAPARAARERRGPLERRPAVEAPGLRVRLRDHGADRVPGDVRLEHDLRRDRPARDGHGRDARAGDDLPARGARRPVDITAGCRAGKVEWVEVENVPCFADRLDAPLEVDGPGDADRRRRLRRHVVRDRRRPRPRLRARAGRGARPVARRRADPRCGRAEQLPVAHPENPDIAA